MNILITLVAFESREVSLNTFLLVLDRRIKKLYTSLALYLWNTVFQTRHYKEIKFLKLKYEINNLALIRIIGNKLPYLEDGNLTFHLK